MATPETRHFGLDRSGVDVAMLGEVLQSLEEPPKNMSETALGLGQLALALESTHIPPAFTVVYHKLSTNIDRAMQDGEFSHPEYIDETAGTFARHYYKNLWPYYEFIKGDDEALDRMAEPWQLPLLDPRVRSPSTLPGLQFSLGMTTHITSRDLVASLMKSKPEEDYYEDFTTGVDRQIKQTTHELAPDLIPGHSILRYASIPFLCGMIALDRREAWDNYWKLRAMPSGEEREARYKELDARAIRRNKLQLIVGKAVTPLAVRSEKLPDPFSQKRAA